MSHHIEIVLHPQSQLGAIPRVLSLIERRGFVLLAVFADSAEPSERRALAVRVTARERDPEALVRHLRNLFDVQAAHVVAPAPAARTHAT